MTFARTLYDKVWDSHAVTTIEDSTTVLYIDLHLVHEVMSPQAFEGLRAAKRKVRRPDLTWAVADHNIAKTVDRDQGVADQESREQLAALTRNARDFGVSYIPLGDPRHGIVHVIGPEQGLTLSGKTIVCGDSTPRLMVLSGPWPSESGPRKSNTFWPRKRSASKRRATCA